MILRLIYFGISYSLSGDVGVDSSCWHDSLGLGTSHRFEVGEVEPQPRSLQDALSGS